MVKNFIKNSSFLPVLPLAICLLSGTSCTGVSKNENESPPNVVFILADDLGWSQTGTYGNQWYRTPNIDQLAREGLRFTRAYAAAAVCSPTRASIMTGKYPARLQLTDFVKGNSDTNYPLSEPEWQKYLPLEEVTLAEMFRDKGYHTGIFGKWHLSRDKKPPESLEFNPDKQGFDEHFITYKPDNSTDPEGDPHNSDTIAALSIDFLKRNHENPFFLVVSFNAIHDPLMENQQEIEEWKKDSLVTRPRNNPIIAAMLERMDNAVGRILSELDALDLNKNTMVIFFSDNGGKESYAAQTPLRAGKGWLYEGGIRVPLIIRWAGKIDPSVSEQQVISNDFFPSFAEMLNVPLPQKVDGISLLSHILYQDSLPQRNLFWHYPHYHKGSGMKPASAIRSGKFKLVEWHEGILPGMDNLLELYDLDRDPGEELDLSEDMPELRDSLYNALQLWRKELNAGMPTVNANF